MTGCTDCWFDWDAAHSSFHADISTMGARYRQAMATMVAGLSSSEAAAMVRSRPSEQVWSAVEYLAHMRDIVDFYDDRIERVLAEDRPVMEVGLRFAELAEVRSYREERVSEVLAQLDHSTERAARRLDGLDREQWDRIGVGSEGGERTVLLLAARLAHEAHHHLVDLESIGRWHRQADTR